MDRDAQVVITFWFGTLAADAMALRQKMSRWYYGGDTLDRELRERFLGLVEKALGGELAGWEADAGPRLALIVILDQFTRNLFRDDLRAYSGDAMAQRLAKDAVERGWDRNMSLEERQFLYMPFLHAEDIGLQQCGIECMERLVADAPVELHELYGMSVEQALKYHGVIARFGRFPHRNALLGRVSTHDEIEFLRDWKAQRPPRAMPQGCAETTGLSSSPPSC